MNHASPRRNLLLVAAQWAGIFGAFVLLVEGIITLRAYRDSIESARADRSVAIADALLEKQFFEEWVSVVTWLASNAMTAEAKLDSLESDAVLGRQVSRILNRLETMAYLFNEEHIDRDFVIRGPGRVAGVTYHAAAFYIEDQHAQGDTTFLQELSRMVQEVEAARAIATALD